MVKKKKKKDVLRSVEAEFDLLRKKDLIKERKAQAKRLFERRSARSLGPTERALSGIRDPILKKQLQQRVDQRKQAKLEKRIRQLEGRGFRGQVKTAISEIGQTKAERKREGKIRFFGSRAEQLEIEMVSINEVPMLRQMDFDRGRAASPPNREFVRVEKEVTDSFPQ